MYASPYGLTVRAVDEPDWHSAGTDDQRDIQRDISGPGGFWALVGPEGRNRWSWSVIDSSDGETVDYGRASTQAIAKQAVLDWERENGLTPEAASPRSNAMAHGERCSCVPSECPANASPGPSAPEDTLRAALDTVNDNRVELARAHESGAGDDSSEADAYLGALENLETVVLDQLGTTRMAFQLAAEAEEAARTSAPPVPGVTRNNGYTVYSVMGVRTNITRRLSENAWTVAAVSEAGEHVTWSAWATEDGRLAYGNGRYHSGDEAAANALIDLANRSNVFASLDELASRPEALATLEASRDAVESELHDTHTTGRAAIRRALLEAAAAGHASLTWTSGRVRRVYIIRYNRRTFTFSWRREI
jgi:hypothetical protein